MGTTLRELIELAGGMSRGNELKFWTPGGSSTPLLTARAPRRAAGLRRGGRGRLDARHHRRCRSSTRTTAWSTRRTSGRSSTSTSRAASARRAARATTGWSGIYERILAGEGTARGPRHAARHLRQHPRPLVLRARRRRDQPGHVVDRSTSSRTTWTTSRAGRPPQLSGSADAGGSALTMTAGEPSARPSTAKDDLVTLTIDGIEVAAPKGTLLIRAAEQLGIADPALLRPPAARPGRRLPAVPGRGQRATAAACQAGRLLHHHGRRRHGGQDPAHLARWPTRRSRASWSCC